MLGWMSKNRSQHPLADEKKARDLLADIPASDPYRALEELAYWLESLRSAEDLRPGRVWEIISLVDRAAKPHQRKLSQEYLEVSSRLQKFQEQRIWNGVVEFWRQLAAAYEFCFAQSVPVGALRPLLPSMVARAIRAHTLELKWALMRYGPVDPTLWGRLSALYSQAEGADFADRVCEVYPGPFGDSTVTREYLKALMLMMSSNGNLPPRKLEIGERVVAQLSEFFVVQATPGPGCAYLVDLSAAKPPARLVARVAPQSACRYFGPGSASDRLRKFIERLETSGNVPPDLNLGADFDADSVVDVLRHLERQWAVVPPERSGERRRTFSRIQVVHELEGILGVLTVAGTAASLDMGETWTVENESEQGFGAVIPASGGDWIRVGGALGFRYEDGHSWGVGVVRRLVNTDDNQRYVGIQTLTRGCNRIRLVPIGPSGRPLDGAQDAVMLPSGARDSTASAEVTVLMRLGGFSGQRNFEMTAYDRRYVIAPKALVEAGADFDMGRFRLVQRVL